MSKYKNIVKDILYVSKLTKTKNKKLLILLAISLSQVSAGIDLVLIASFASLIASQQTNLETLNAFLLFIDSYRFVIILLVIFRYFVSYSQQAILKKIELSVTISLRMYLFSKILDQRNFSVSDSRFYINTLSTHISFFYSSFSIFLNHFLQACAYTAYLLISDTELFSFFAIAVFILSIPTAKLISSSRKYIREEYNQGIDLNKDLDSVLENFSLIKILRMEEKEKKSFNKSLKNIYGVVYKNFQVQTFTAQLPNFFTLIVFSIILNISSFATKITLDILGVTIRLFQSLSNVSTSLNRVANSQVHIKEFMEFDKISVVRNPNYLSLIESNKIELKNVDFKFLNSKEYIFKNLNLEIEKNTHNLIVGPNGSGKSTLLGLIGNVLTPESGKLFTYTEKFAYIGASPFIFNTTLRNNILYGNSYKISDAEMNKILKDFRLFNEISNYDLDKIISNKTLSSGQMQKIAFIRAFLIKPDVLLLDESMANLDENSTNLIMKLISEQKITVINSTHDPEKFENIDSVVEIEIIDENRVLKVTK